MIDVIPRVAKSGYKQGRQVRCDKGTGRRRRRRKKHETVDAAAP